MAEGQEESQLTWRKLIHWGSLPSWVLFAIAAAWKRIWRAIELAGDIDFLIALGGRWPGLRDFILDWGWLVAVCAGFAWLYIYIRAEETHRRIPKIKLSQVFLVLAMVAGLSAAFAVGRLFPYVGSLLVYYEPIENWGLSPYLRIQLNLDMSELTRFSDEFKVAALCRIPDPTIDFLQDRLLMSQQFSIADRVEIQIDPPPWFQDRACTLTKEFECKPALISKDGRIRTFSQRIGRSIASDIKCLPASP